MIRPLWRELLLCTLSFLIAVQAQPGTAQEAVPGLTPKQLKYLKSLKRGYFAPIYLPSGYKASTIRPDFSEGTKNDWYHIIYSNGVDGCYVINVSDGGYGAGDDDKIAYKRIASSKLGVIFDLSYLKGTKTQWSGGIIPNSCFYSPAAISKYAASSNNEAATCVDISDRPFSEDETPNCKKTISRSEIIQVVQSLRYFSGKVRLRSCKTENDSLNCLP